MTAWQYVPGVPAAGHITGSGYWHPGKIDGCAKCPAPECIQCRRPIRDIRYDHRLDCRYQGKAL
jgi:hypothetical protein